MADEMGPKGNDERKPPAMNDNNNSNDVVGGLSRPACLRQSSSGIVTSRLSNSGNSGIVGLFGRGTRESPDDDGTASLAPPKRKGDIMGGSGSSGARDSGTSGYSENSGMSSNRSDHQHPGLKKPPPNSSAVPFMPGGGPRPVHDHLTFPTGVNVTNRHQHQPSSRLNQSGDHSQSPATSSTESNSRYNANKHRRHVGRYLISDQMEEVVEDDDDEDEDDDNADEYLQIQMQPQPPVQARDRKSAPNYNHGTRPSPGHVLAPKFVPPSLGRKLSPPPLRMARSATAANRVQQHQKHVPYPVPQMRTQGQRALPPKAHRPPPRYESFHRRLQLPLEEKKDEVPTPTPPQSTDPSTLPAAAPTTTTTTVPTTITTTTKRGGEGGGFFQRGHAIGGQHGSATFSSKRDLSSSSASDRRSRRHGLESTPSKRILDNVESIMLNAAANLRGPSHTSGPGTSGAASQRQQPQLHPPLPDHQHEQQQLDRQRVQETAPYPNSAVTRRPVSHPPSHSNSGPKLDLSQWQQQQQQLQHPQHNQVPSVDAQGVQPQLQQKQLGSGKRGHRQMRYLMPDDNDQDADEDEDDDDDDDDDDDGDDDGMGRAGLAPGMEPYKAPPVFSINIGSGHDNNDNNNDKFGSNNNSNSSMNDDGAFGRRIPARMSQQRNQKQQQQQQPQRYEPSFYGDDRGADDDDDGNDVDNIYGERGDHAIRDVANIRQKNFDSTDDEDDFFPGVADTDKVAANFFGVGSNHGPGGVGNDPTNRRASAASRRFGGDNVYYDELYDLCYVAGRLERNVEFTDADYVEHDLSWDPVREWLQNHATEHVLTSLEFRDDQKKTALHIACERQPPMDIIDYLLSLLSSSSSVPSNAGLPQYQNQQQFGQQQPYLTLLETQDEKGWTPLHHACANAAAAPVVQTLAEYWPPTKLVQTETGMTPLHVALISPLREYPELVATLASTGACFAKDEEGVLPLHYGCAFGASEESLRVIIASNEAALEEMDDSGQSPLHFALANAKITPHVAPRTLRLLIRENPDLVHSPATEAHKVRHPIEFLQEVSKKLSADNEEAREEIKESLRKCLTILLDAKPIVTPHVITTVRSLRSWLFSTAILSPHLQDALNRKMKSRFPTTVLMLDLYVQIAVLIFYHICVEDSLERRFLSDQTASVTAMDAVDDLGDFSRRAMADVYVNTGDVSVPNAGVFVLYVGGAYFVIRESVQAFSLIRLRRSVRRFLQVFFFQASDLLDFAYIALLFGWASAIRYGIIEDQYAFRNWAAVSASVLWAKFFLFLRSMSIDFSVFVTGAFYVAGKLVPYMVGLICFFIAFMQIFYTIFLEDDYYDCPRNDEEFEMSVMDMQCFDEGGDFNSFCTRWQAFLRVYTMFLGEVNERDFAGSPVATFYFGIFMLLMVILLANVLIATVTNAYKIIQDEEAEAVFYTDRLNFLAEAAVIRNFPLVHLVWYIEEKNDMDFPLKVLWMTLWSNFEVGPDEVLFCGYKFWTTHFPSMLLSICAIPIWFAAGLVTLGIVWPPQIREWLFTSTLKRTLAQQDSEFREMRQQEEKRLEAQLTETHERFRETLAETRQHIAQTKVSLSLLRQEIRKKIFSINVVVQNMYEQEDYSRIGSIRQ